MKYLSVCSGIEAASVAWESLGWEPVGFSEIEPFPSAVLQYRYPNVTNYGDMTKFKEWDDVGKFDILVGGTPCQSFSVAGLRQGIKDPRGNLMLTFGAIADYYKPAWIVWENVPGVLSANGGGDFGAFLGMLAELGYGIAYRVLNAEYFGVPQRRRRVFVVGYFGDWRRAASVLFESESLQGDIVSSRKEGERTARSLDKCPEKPILFEPLSADGCPRIHDDVCPTLLTAQGGQRQPCICLVDQGGEIMDVHIDRSGTLKAHGGTSYIVLDQEDICLTDQGGETMSIDKVAGTLKGEDRARVYVMAHGQANAEIQEGKSPTLNCNHEAPIVLQGNTIGRKPENGAMGKGWNNKTCYTLTSTDNHGVLVNRNLRRLTPRECERLQGFPDDWTKIPYRGRTRENCPDSPRYKAIGNSMAVPVMHWIGARIQREVAE